MNRLFIDGNEVNADGLEEFAPEFGLNDDSQTYTYSLGSTLTIYGDAAKELSELYFGSCDGIAVVTPIRIYVACCDTWMDFSITYEGATFCRADCSFSFNPQRITENTRAYNLLNDKIYWRQDFVDAFDHPQVWYCDQPGIVQQVLLGVLVIFQQIIVLFDILISIIDNICNVVTLGFGECDIDPEDNVSTCAVLDQVLGCGNKVPSPLIKDILEYNATRAGLTLKSSIFQQGVYSRTVLFQLQYARGRRSPVNWIGENGANLTTIQLLDQLKPVFNIDYRLINGELCVERKDYFDSITPNVGTIDGNFCQTFKQDNACAYGRFAYSDDALDKEGNRSRIYTDDIIEYNAEAADYKKGECTATSSFGRGRFMFDQNSANDRGVFNDWDSDRLRNGQLSGVFFTAALCERETRSRDLIIQNDQASLLKLLVLEENYNVDDARVIRKPITGATFPNSRSAFWYNYPLSYREFEPDGTTLFTDGLQQFHAIDNPNNSGRKIFVIDSATMELTCERFQTILNSDNGVKVSTPIGEGFAETISVDFQAGIITFTNVSVKCE